MLCHSSSKTWTCCYEQLPHDCWIFGHCESFHHFAQSRPAVSGMHLQYNTIHNITSLPSVNTLIAWGMFCGAMYTHHTFTPIIKHLITTTANKNPGKKSFIDKNMRRRYTILGLFKNSTKRQQCLNRSISSLVKFTRLCTCHVWTDPQESWKDAFHWSRTVSSLFKNPNLWWHKQKRPRSMSWYGMIW